MSDDPFDLLREQNPMSDDQPVYAPMSTATDIVEKRPRRARPAWILAGAAAAAVLIAGGAWMLWLNDPNGSTPVADDSTSTSVATTAVTETTTGTTSPTAPPTTVEATTTTVIDYQPLPDVAVYLFMNDNGTQTAPVPFLAPINRPLAILSHIVEDPIYEAVMMLLSGPAPGEAEGVPALITEIPAGTGLLGLEVTDGIADVDLSGDFVAAGTARSMLGRLGQVVFTLTRFDEVDAVTFRIDGEPTTVFGEGPTREQGGYAIELETPVTRDGWGDLTPAILIEDPAHGGLGSNPLVVTGTANVFEATITMALTDADGLIIWEGFTTATCGTGCRGDFEVTIPYEVDEIQRGALIAWEVSMEDGRQTNVREHPVVLMPSGEGATTTTQPNAIDALRSEWTELDKALEAALTRIDEIDGLLAAATKEQIALETEQDDLWRQVDDLRSLLTGVLDAMEALGAQPQINCSASEADPALPIQPDLPDQVADIRRAMFEAALTCDWDALTGLIEGPFSSSFGEPSDPIAMWQRRELLHLQPMYYLAEILRRPFALDVQSIPSTYAWPSAFVGAWDTISDADREALRPLYDEVDFAGFATIGGYAGYRVGIVLDGNSAQWRFFIEGD